MTKSTALCIFSDTKFIKPWVGKFYNLTCLLIRSNKIKIVKQYCLSKSIYIYSKSAPIKIKTFDVGVAKNTKNST